MTIDIIEQARNRFDPELHTDEYKKIHSDDDQLHQLIDLFEVKGNERYFDLGTGNGYFQQLKPDGHVHFCREDEIDDLFRKNGFHKEKSFVTYATYPRHLDDKYLDLLNAEEKAVHEQYAIRIDGDLVYITVECMNCFYRKDCHLAR